MAPVERIAYFVTPHGFGHAARAAAVIEAVSRRDRSVAFEILTTVPEWFFEQSLTTEHRMHPIASDVGMVQIDPFREDPEATVSALARFWSSLENVVETLLDHWRGMPPNLIVSDISPLGLKVAHRLGVPSVLVENFTWDWIYSAYEAGTPALREFGERVAATNEMADLRIQCEPECRAVEGAIRVPPVSRSPRGSRPETRRALGLDDTDRRPMVLLTLGGMGWGDAAVGPDNDCIYVTLGGTDRISRSAGLIRLPNRSPVYPPDIVWAADAVVAKLGYSTVAECFRAGVPLGYIGRPSFPESPVLEAFVRTRMPSIEFTSETMKVGAWNHSIRRLLELPRSAAHELNGADEIAALLIPDST